MTQLKHENSFAANQIDLMFFDFCISNNLEKSRKIIRMFHGGHSQTFFMRLDHFIHFFVAIAGKFLKYFSVFYFESLMLFML